MTTVELMTVAATAIFVIGLVATIVTRDLIRRIVALNIGSAGAMLLLIAIATRGDASHDPDPVPQALVLTGIVVMAAITGLALTLARRVERLRDEEEQGSEQSGVTHD